MVQIKKDYRRNGSHLTKVETIVTWFGEYLHNSFINITESKNILYNVMFL